MVLALLLSLLFIAVVMAGAGCGEKKEEVTEEPKLVGSVTSESMEVEAGQDFQVVLDANPSTGYDWTVAEKPDPNIVEQAGEEAVQPPEGQTMTGAPIKEIWKFKAVAAGKTDIVFENARSWEKDVPPAATHNVAVTAVAAHPKPAQPTEPRTYKDPDAPIAESVGNEFRIDLSEQTASTGFKWLLDSGYDHKVCVFQGVYFITAEGAAVGAASTEVWKFKALGAGTTKLVFNYIQPWEKDAAPARTVTFTVNVK